MGSIYQIPGRDSFVNDICEYFETGKFEKVPEKQRINLLNDQEKQLIMDEHAKCSSEFRYAAKNYFWISTKEGLDKLFELWDGQELVLEKLAEIKSRGKAQKIIVVKARQLGLSLLGTALMFWLSGFRPNRNALIASEDEDQSKNIFNAYINPMYRRLPWWLRPANSSFALDEGIKFDLPMKEGKIGLNSLLRIQWANRKGGLGQGYKLNGFHGSEFTSWIKFSEALEEDLKYALVNSQETIAILESTAKGAGTPAHVFYKKCMDLAEKSDWEAIFLPYFFEKSRILAPPHGWKHGDEEKRMVSVTEANWVRCNEAKCLKYFARYVGSHDLSGDACPKCKKGILRAYILTDKQLYFMANEREVATDPKIVKQELALTAEEAFIASGEMVFSEKSIERVEYFCEISPKPKKGFFDKHGLFHGYNEDDLERRCHLTGCEMFHRESKLDLWVWEEPIPNANYNIGVDVGYGKGKDESVCWVNRLGSKGSDDIHVATFASNSIDPLNFAYEVSKLGRWYNDAQVAIEYNTPGNSTADQLLNNLSYPNIYRRRGQEVNRVSGSYHWLTTQATKPKIIVTMDRWLKDGVLYARDRRFLHQLKMFRKADDSMKTGAEKGENDDILMAAMICLYTAHQTDYEDNYGIVPTKVEKDSSMCFYKMACQRCKKDWGADNPSMINKCPFCSCMMMTAIRNLNLSLPPDQDPRRQHRDFDPEPDGVGASWEEDEPRIKSYAEL